MAASTTRTAKTPAAKRVRKTTTKIVGSSETICLPSDCELAVFADGGGQFEGFRFFRHFYRGEGPRPPIEPLINAKLRPGDDPKFGGAAKVDVLLPDDAPGDYMDVRFLVERYQSRHQSWEPTAFIQLNFYAREGESALSLYECARAFCRAQFALIGCPVVLTLHIPGFAGHENRWHCHAQILPRSLGPMGFVHWHRDLACDEGNRSIYAAWAAHRAVWG